MARRVISTSNDLSVDIRRLGFGHKIVHIPNGYDADFFRPLPELSGESPVILAVRRHVPKNGIQFLIAALPALVDRFPNLRCDLIGNGRMHDELRSLASLLGVEQHVRFLGSLGHDDVYECYREAHVVVIPSTAESTSLSCIEAMGVARPVVASRVGGLIELLGKNQERGYLVPITDSEHCSYDAPNMLPPEKIQMLADAIAHVLESRPEAFCKANAAAKYVREHFDWTIIARRTIDEVYGCVFS